MLPGSASSPEGADPLIGRVFGGAYTVEELIGTGGYGAVYRGKQLAVGRDVAIKVLRTDRFVAAAEKERRRKRFKREAIATSRLAHPNTVRLIDFGESEDRIFYLVLELLRGVELSDLIERSAPLSPHQVAKIARQVCGSLAEAHAAGIIHRDLKPGNIFVCEFAGEDDFVKVMDFSIARLTGPGQANTQLTISGTTQGTPHYMAPEQALAEDTGAQTDLYALGCIIYEMLTGQLVFPEADAMSVLLAHVQKPRPSLHLPGQPDALVAAWQELLDGLLAKAPADRLQSAADVANKLALLERGESTASRAKLRQAAPTTREPGQTDIDDRPRATPSPAEPSHHDLDTVTVEAGPPVVDAGVPSNAAVAAAAVAAGLLALGVVIGATRLLGTDTAPPAVAPAGGSGTSQVYLELTSSPPGAQVWLVGDEEGDALCQTPCDVEVTGGADDAELVLRLAGHEDARVRVDLTDDVELDEPVPLTPVAGGDEGAGEQGEAAADPEEAPAEPGAAPDHDG